MLLLGIDLGSSSVKASVTDGESGKCLASAFYPKDEMKIIALKPGWAEQEPETWWSNLKSAILDCNNQLGHHKGQNRCNRYIVPDARTCDYRQKL